MKLTRAEEEIMQIIWELDRCTVSDIRNYMAEKMEIKKPPHSTISTLVRSIEKKEFLNHKAYGRTHEYFPIVTKKEYSKINIKNLVNGYFNGSMNNLVSFLVKENDLKASELDDLINQLEGNEEE